MIDTSIVVTNYNSEFFIPRALKSVFAQTYPAERYELIFVDDGSSDRSVLAADVFMRKNNEKGIKTSIIEKENGGTASARNAGVEASSGMYIGFLDVDDSYLPEKTSKSVDILSSCVGVDIVYSDYVTEWSGSEHSLTMKPPYSLERLFETCVISTNSFVKKSAIDRVGGFDEKIKIIEDYDLWLRICASGGMAKHIPQHLFTYTEHELSKTNQEKSNGMSLFEKETSLIKNRVMRGDYYVQNA